MSEPIEGRELLAVRARTMRARDGVHLHQVERDREALLREVYRLRDHAEGFAALHRSAESDVSAVIALVARWEQGVANLYAANEEEAVPETAAIRSARAAQIECCIKELRDALSAPHSPAAARTGTSAATEASGGAREAQEG